MRDTRLRSYDGVISLVDLVVNQENPFRRRERRVLRLPLYSILYDGRINVQPSRGYHVHGGMLPHGRFAGARRYRKGLKPLNHDESFHDVYAGRRKK